MLDTIRSLFHRLSYRLQTGVLVVFLHLFFVMGIGLTAIVARIFGQGFMTHSFKESAWKPMTGSAQPEKLF